MDLPVLPKKAKQTAEFTRTRIRVFELEQEHSGNYITDNEHNGADVAKCFYCLNELVKTARGED